MMGADTALAPRSRVLDVAGHEAVLAALVREYLSRAASTLAYESPRYLRMGPIHRKRGPASNYPGPHVHLSSSAPSPRTRP